MFEPNTYYYILASISILGAGLMGIGSLVWWLSNQFRDVRNLVYVKFDELSKMLSEKIEYHERHDDQRFNSISNDLWAIRIRNAARDGIQIPATVVNKTD